MPLTLRNLSTAAYAFGQKVYLYTTLDLLAQVTSDSYWDHATELRKGDWILITARDGATVRVVAGKMPGGGVVLAGLAP
jgi:hypothetical protein